ncbi:hypothetical protein ACGFJ7_12340 [Actinoplanes sp. NPDC048988]|uniref:hypothetical protein n=1 Tax=Actinoplanes sp. NPDC048988 TaxID=3363901 RepID=UPI00371CC4BB
MSDVVPALDTIEFGQLVELARGAIPRYAPDWTDHNLHDPGMTIVDLLAWIVDQQVYRTGRVGGRHRRAFAALLGRRPEGPAPARGLIWPARPVRTGTFLPPGSAMTCGPHRDLRFALDRPEALYLPPVTLTRITGDGAVRHLDFDGPLGPPAGGAQIALGFDVVPPPGPAVSAEQPWAPVRYAYRTAAHTWAGLPVRYDGTAGMARTGAVVLAVPPAAAAATRLRVSFDFPLLPRIAGISVNVLPVVQREHVQGLQFTSAGTGQPDQVVDLDTDGLLPEPALTIEVDGEPWQERGDFSRSGPRDPHYVVEPGRIRFGNGVNGRRPRPGAPIQHTGYARTAGAEGNLRAGLTWSVPALGPDGREYGRNRQAVAGGRGAAGDRESVIMARDAAVGRVAVLTDDELAAAARSLPGMAVERAEVIAGFDHRLPGRRVDGVRTLVVVPHAARYLAEVAARLEPRRVLGERLVVRGPVVVTVDLWLTVTPEPGVTAADAVAAAERALGDRLSPARAPLGRGLTVADVRTIAATAPGVADVPGVRMTPEPRTVRPDAMVVAGRIRVTPAGGER